MSRNIRCFFAIELPFELKERIAAFLSELKKHASGVKWVKSDALHITLKFMGNQPPEQVDKLVTTLLSNPLSVDGFGIRVEGFGAFPNKRRPRVFWLGVESLPRTPLYSLFEQLEQQLEPLGFERENRRFSPHLTLGRVKTPADFDRLWNWAEGNPFRTFQFEVESFVLMQSILKPSGAEYKLLQKYPLHTI